MDIQVISVPRQFPPACASQRPLPKGTRCPDSYHHRPVLPAPVFPISGTTQRAFFPRLASGSARCIRYSLTPRGSVLHGLFVPPPLKDKVRVVSSAGLL